MDQTNYEIARELIEEHAGTEWGTDGGWDAPAVEVQLAVMQAAAMLAVADEIRAAAVVEPIIIKPVAADGDPCSP